MAPRRPLRPDLAGLRREYMRAGLDEADLAPGPMEQFQLWFEQALAAEVEEPNAMTLATASPEGRPSARIVLLKGLEEDSFIFYTNYESQKGRELDANPYAALVFFWPELERQVRATGKVLRLEASESERYFSSRPRGSQIGAWASAQSGVIPGRQVLEERLAELEAEFADREVPLPPFWGGYRVVPEVVEFWQGRPSRLHDRLRYRHDRRGEWICERLAP